MKNDEYEEAFGHHHHEHEAHDHTWRNNVAYGFTVFAVMLWLLGNDYRSVIAAYICLVLGLYLAEALPQPMTTLWMGSIVTAWLLAFVFLFYR